MTVSLMKILAIIGMLIDHIGSVFGSILKINRVISPMLSSSPSSRKFPTLSPFIL